MPARNNPRRDLLEKRLDTLYRTDPRGGIVCTNEWDARPAPRFHLMRTAEGPILRCRAGLPQDLVRHLEALCSRENWDRASPRQPWQYDQLLELVATHAPIQSVSSGPAYMCVRDFAPGRAPIAIDRSNAHLLQRTFADWLADVPHRQPFMAFVEAGEAVAVCASVRISQAVHCAGVETHTDHRRRGHGADVVAGWARAVQALGATAFYSTSWDNLASQGVARRLGLDLVGADFHVS